MIRAGIIGLGKMGISHYAIMNALNDVKVAAVCDTSGFLLSTLKKQTQVDTYKDYKEMIDQANLDCVLVATPTRFHAESARYALEKNLHVFVEKPFALSVEEGRALSDLAVRKKRVNQVGYNNRFIGTFIEAQRLVKAGVIGEAYHVLGEVYGPVVVREQSSTWRSKKSEGGGCLHDYAAHVIDLMNFAVGPPKQIAGTVLKSIYSRDVEDAVFATLSYANGMSGQLAANWSDDAYRKITTRLTIFGTKGKVFCDRQECQLYLKEGAASGGFPSGWTIRYITELQKPVSFYLRGEEYSAQLEYFIDSIRNNRLDNVCSFAAASDTDNVIDMITKASKAKS
jgi:scyllo-inositol 2-dehydrogenase (NADP+)